MSTTRPHPAGDCGPEPEGTAAAAAPRAGRSGVSRAGGAPCSGGAGAVAAAPMGDESAGAADGAEQADDAGETGEDAGGEWGGETMRTATETENTTAVAEAPEAAEAAEADPELEDGQGGTVRQVRRLRLVSAAGPVPRARDFLRQALQDWGWLPAQTADQRAAAEDALLVVSELVTNACLHADGPEELRVGVGPKVLRVEIVDLGTGAPAPRTPHRAGRPGGHGMFIVQRLCLDWGVVRNEDGKGKTVWAELAAPG